MKTETVEKVGHTPGPWSSEYKDGNDHIDINADSRTDWDRTIAETTYTGGDSEANARLIASAPELLEACKQQHEAIDRLFAMLIVKTQNFYPSKSGQPWEACVRGNEAIARVEGR